MTFSNPAGAATANAHAYREAVIALIGQRDPLDVLSELPEWLRQKLRNLDDARLRKPGAPGKWSVIEVVAHLNDAELVHGYRTRMIVAEREPPLPGYDQDGWALAFRLRVGAPGNDLGDADGDAGGEPAALARVHAGATGAGGTPQRAGSGERGAVPAPGGRTRPGAPAADRPDPEYCVSGER